MQPLVTTEPLLVSLLLGLDEIVSNDLHLRKGKWHLREGEMAFTEGEMAFVGWGSGI